MGTVEWPEEKPFAVFLSHDVDRVRKTYQFIPFFIMERRLYHLRSMFEKPNPYWCFDKIMEIEKRHEVRSTFFFLQETKKLNIIHPSSYILSLGHYAFNEPAVSEIIKKLDGGGWEIGLHGSYDSYKKKDLLVQEKKELEKIVGKPIIGIRQHFLNIEVPQTWQIQRELGFHYDATFGLKKDIGFLEEKYLPFRPFDDSFLVIPLCVMDGSAFSKYPDENRRWEKIKELIHQAKEKKGVVSFLWHQRVFNEKEFPGWAPLYEKIIEECKAENAWFATGRDISEWMKKNR